MRKILLATSALVAFAGAAQAAESPIAVNIGGYDDFRGALMHENSAIVGSGATGGDFQNEYQINIEATGKATRGVEYGAKIGLWNGLDGATNGANRNGSNNNVTEHDAYVWLSGNFGKAVFGDAHSASTDLFVGAPTIGEGQIDGNYTNFVDQTKLIVLTPAYANDDNNSTKVTYYTPKVGSANHKVQLGVSFTPDEEQGTMVDLTKNGQSSYKNTTGAGLQYTGKMGAVSAIASGIVNVSTANNDFFSGLNAYKDYTSYGAGTQLTYGGFTVGGSYVDAGHQFQLKNNNANKQQDVWTVGAKYGFDKVAFAANYLTGRGYAPNLSTSTTGTGTTYAVAAGQEAYVRDYQAYGVGATYTWFPGLSTAADAVLFKQKLDDTNRYDNPSNVGHVLMLSQKLAF